MKLFSICSIDNLEQGHDKELTHEGLGFVWPQSPPSTAIELGSVMENFTDVDWLFQ